MPHQSRLLTIVVVLLALFGLQPVAAEEYAIGPRDVLRITVWGQEDLTKDYPIDEDGFLAFPFLGRTKIAGLTVTQLAAHLRDALEKDYLVNPQVLVSVKQYLSRKVYVLGEARGPGTFYLTRPTTLLDALSQAGGLSQTAGKQVVLVRTQRAAEGTPSGSTILRLNVEKIQAGDASHNIRLEDEDQIFVPKAQAFFVLGEVKHAGTFPLDKPTSVLEAVTIAGGFSDKAAPSAAKLIRRTPDGKEETLAIDLSGRVPRDRDVRVQDGDTLLVPKGNTFFVFGEVKKPGAYQLDKETNILEGITIAGGFTDKASPSRTRVIRTTAQGQQILTVDMSDVIKRGQQDGAIVLQENDVVVVPESFF
jgi:polysaccharide export outer membrane protein